MLKKFICASIAHSFFGLISATCMTFVCNAVILEPSSAIENFEPGRYKLVVQVNPGYDAPKFELLDFQIPKPQRQITVNFGQGEPDAVDRWLHENDDGSHAASIKLLRDGDPRKKPKYSSSDVPMASIRGRLENHYVTHLISFH